ncbi:galactosyl transferase GMA12/MNN10 domain protein [Caballeronia fortuita]|uniref:Galactosyl transferase GMA12/MNN10 domain protein n=1 Tax=Caballeronia fortuita TaxID=1777138 RepID=A0A158DFA8_9BURK|nr:hypothetical protein [Caballeronia fortuita]SAK93279.1 galactosyl transferase GMA12/MNN10 domain protein [Caballeronia fortuita]
MIVVSLLFDRAPGALANHRAYARALTYRHEALDLSDLSGSDDATRWAYKYEALSRCLNQAANNEIILLLSENAAILRTVDLPSLMAGRDWLVTCSESDQAQTDVLIFRNTESVRTRIAELVRRCRYGIEQPLQEGELLRDFPACPQQYCVGDVMVVVPAATNTQTVWANWNAFSLSFRDEKQHRRYRAAVFEHINECRARGLPYLSLVDTGVRETSGHSVYQPNRAIAVVTLYTPNVAQYGRIAEANFRRYCERHGYTLYVHREIPAQLNDGKATGNWHKAALLREYLPNHQWVFWLDADVLINDMNRRLEPLTHECDTVFARDVGTWDFNSGIMGFQRNQHNYDALARVIDECGKLEDKSKVYASRGDQHYFIRAFETMPEYDPTRFFGFIDLNTPWIYRRPDSFMVHYLGMWEDNRALVMDYDLRHAAME